MAASGALSYNLFVIASTMPPAASLNSFPALFLSTSDLNLPPLTLWLSSVKYLSYIDWSLVKSFLTANDFLFVL